MKKNAAYLFKASIGVLFLTSASAAMAGPLSKSKPKISTSVRLDFDGIIESTNILSSDKISCIQQDVCHLKRSHLSDVPIRTSEVSYNELKNNNPINLIMTFDYPLIYQGTIIRAIDAKYGKYTSNSIDKSTDRYGHSMEVRVLEWKNFQDGNVSLVVNEDRMTLIWRWSRNAKTQSPPKIDF
jgi:hypothetical protein